MSLKDKWKEAGKDLGQTFAGLGKAVAQSVREGVDAATDDGAPKEARDPSQKTLKESWTEVGHSFGKTGKALGAAAAGTAKTVMDKIDDEGNGGE